jgi:hypothetical protein
MGLEWQMWETIFVQQNYTTQDKVILDVIHMSFFCHSKNDVTFKIIILIKIFTSFLERHKYDI